MENKISLRKAYRVPFGHESLQRSLLPASELVKKGREAGSEHPGNQKGDKDAGTASPRKLRSSGKVSDSISKRDPDRHGCYHGNPHGSHRVAGSPHYAGKALRDLHGDIAHSQYFHHIKAELYQFGRRSEYLHQITSEKQDQDRDHRRGSDRKSVV